MLGHRRYMVYVLAKYGGAQKKLALVIYATNNIHKLIYN